MKPNEQDDEGMREYLEGDSALSRLYRRGAREQPAAELDARILAEARRAVSPKGRVVHGPFARHWMVPASLAAVFVLSVSVVVLMPGPERPAVETEQADGSALPAAPVSDAPGGVPSAGLEQRPARLAAPAAADRAGQRGSGVEDDSAAGRQRSGELLEKSSEKRSAQAPAANSSGAASTVPAAAEPAGAVGEARAPAAPAAAPGPLPAASVRDDPRAWLHFVEGLLDAGNQTGALASLRAFRDRYPDHPLPERLADLLASAAAEPP